MKSRRIPKQPWRLLRTLLGAMVVTLLTMGTPMTVSAAFAQEETGTAGTEQEVTDGTLQWGIKEAWRNYIGVGPGAAGPGSPGEMVADGGATVDSAHITTWSGGVGTVDLAAGTGTISYQGTMTFRGHPGDWYAGGWGMTQTYSNPQITLTSPTTATLSFEMTQTSALPTWPALPNADAPGPRYDIAELSFPAGDLDDGEVVGATTTLTQTGAYIWNNYGAYVPGAQMDPVSFSLTAKPIAQQQPTETTLTASAATITPGQTVTLTVSVEPAIAGTITVNQDGEAVTVSSTANGTASYSSDALTAGEHSFTAEFVPDDTGYASSSAEPVSIVVEAPSENTTTAGSLQWGVKSSFRSYLLSSIANGKITPSAGATQEANNGIFDFPQAASGTQWDGNVGSVQYAGVVNFFGHDGVLNVNLANPVITVLDAKQAQLEVPFGSEQTMIVLATIDLESGTVTHLDADTVRYSNARVFLAKSGEQFFSDPTGQGGSQPFYAAGTELDRITFTVGAGSDVAATEQTQPTPKASVATAPQQQPKPQATGGSETVAGSLTWSVSNYFAQYTTEKSGASCPTPSKHCAGGTIETNGVGSGWLFPQATGGSWNAQTQTGSVQFSGVVTFSGYGMTMFQVANPSITVTSASSATLNTGYSGSYGPGSVELDLSAATKTVGQDGSVTWSGVPVLGSLMGISEGQGIGFDSLSFTVGQASTASYGSTQQGSDAESSYEAAATAPTTSGLEVLTEPERIVAGGRIEIAAAEFAPNDDGVLVVLYSGETGQSAPMVLAENAQADASGRVEWSGTLPKDVTGASVITLQGSTAAGAAITIREKQPVATTWASDAAAGGATTASEQPQHSTETSSWEWWVVAGALCAIAVCTSVLARRQWAAANAH